MFVNTSNNYMQLSIFALFGTIDVITFAKHSTSTKNTVHFYSSQDKAAVIKQNE